jgi:uncharacterized protein with ParB-like and HNH nuclease domain
MSNRTRPYQSQECAIGAYLGKNLIIPMNQREYSWTKEEIIPVLHDIKELFENTAYKELMGSIIVYLNKINDVTVNEIYDGQQRTISLFIILTCIGEISENEQLYKSINNLLTVDSFLGIPHDLQKNIKTSAKWKDLDIKIPKIYCINPYDNDAIISLLNNQIFNSWKYIDNIDEFKNIDSVKEVTNTEEAIEDEEIENNLKYTCKICKTDISRFKDFQRHLKKIHDIYEKNEDSKKSNIYQTYINVYKELLSFNYNLEQLKRLYIFITQDIEIQLYEASDSFYVSKIFEWQNNRGNDVKKLDLVKNIILSYLDNNKKLEIFNKWEELKKEDHNSTDEFGQKILDCAVQIYNKKFARTIDDSFYKKIIENGNKAGDIYKEIINFINLANKLIELMNKITNSRFGRLITKSRCLSWEPYCWCMLPIFYKKNAIDEKLIKLFVMYYFRNKIIDRASCNSLRISNEFINIVTHYYEIKPDIDYYGRFKAHLCKITNTDIYKDSLLAKINKLSFKNIKFNNLLLSFIETCETPDSTIVSLEYSLEHIYSQKNKDNLSNKDMLNYIGNLTLLEKKNSQNGHKGNSSIGCSEFQMKKHNSYNGSSAKITRDICKDFTKDTFEESDIIKRTKIIADKIEKYTNYLV